MSRIHIIDAISYHSIMSIFGQCTLKDAPGICDGFKIEIDQIPESVHTLLEIIGALDAELRTEMEALMSLKFTTQASIDSYSSAETIEELLDIVCTSMNQHQARHIFNLILKSATNCPEITLNAWCKYKEIYLKGPIILHHADLIEIIEATTSVPNVRNEAVQIYLKFADKIPQWARDRLLVQQTTCPFSPEVVSLMRERNIELH